MTIERDITDGMDVTEDLPDPVTAGSAEVLAQPIPEAPAIPTDPSGRAKARLGDRAFRGSPRGRPS